MKILKRLATRSALAVLLCFTPAVLHAQTPPPGGGSTWPTNLNYWPFSDTNTWISDNGFAPLSFTNILAAHLGDIIGGNGAALILDSTNPAWLQYNVYESDGSTNLTVNSGSTLLWFSPNWASATTNNNGFGPGGWGRLLDVGAYSTNASGWWSLLFDPGATNIYFGAQTNSGNGATTTYLSAPIDWASNEWHNVALTYSSSNSALYLDGALVTTGSGISVYPGPNVLTNGFWIGSDSNGVNQAHGLFDDVLTYNFPLDSNTVAQLYSSFRSYYVINPMNKISAIPYVPLGSSSSVSNYFYVISGSGSLNLVGSAASCVNSTNVWMTNMTCVLTTNGASYTFTIQGGSNNVPYDVFANTYLSFGTNGVPWTWLGQGSTCNIYTISNLPPVTAFLILGNSQIDSDGDGLSDAFERLVSHTNPNNSDTDLDGVSDFMEWIQGRNPITPYSTIDTNGVVKFIIYTPFN